MLKKALAIVFFIACFIIIGVKANSVWDNYKMRSPEAQSAAVQNLESAKKFLLGTWTYTEPLDRTNEYIGSWAKWNILADGKIEIFDAYPSDNDWGKPSYEEYEIITNKYSDTGVRFYAIAGKKTLRMAVILPSGNLSYSLGGKGAVLMKKGDKFPFSK